jgi:L-ascorbate metabolism protein UlaG (beta-lactamase superfamily)
MTGFVKRLFLGMLGVVLMGCELSLRLFTKRAYKGPKSDHFNGRYFFNPHVSRRKFGDFLKWMLTRQPVPWPEKRIAARYHPQPQPFVTSGMQATFINHSTVLIQWDGVNLLTDPVWAERCSPFKNIGPKRIHEPGIGIDQLPPIHFILLSHNHYDHLDIHALRTICARFHPKIITGLGVKMVLNKHGIDHVVELDWWDQYLLTKDLTCTFTPAQHFSSRGLGDRDFTLWGSFFIQGPSKALYFAGDTGYGPHFKEIKKRCGVPSLALLPIGTYEPRWFMRPVHMSPVESVQAHIDLGSRQSMGIHFGTFNLSDEGLYDPPKLLREALKRNGLEETAFWVMEPGEARSVR